MAEKKKSILSMEIGRKKTNEVRIPTKKGINFITNDKHKTNVHAMICFLIFLVCLGLFTYFGVIRLLQKANDAASAYNSIQAQIDQLNNSMSDYDQIQEQYNNEAGSFMSDDELASDDRMEILSMIDEDIRPTIAIQDIHITSSQISITSSETTLSAVSNVIRILQSDARNSYATVTTTSANNSTSSDQVIADFEITYAGTETDSSSTASSSDELTIANAPFIADKALRKFHVRTCPQVSEIDDFNKVPFRTAKDALAEGYVACDECNPQ